MSSRRLETIEELNMALVEILGLLAVDISVGAKYIYRSEQGRYKLKIDFVAHLPEVTLTFDSGNPIKFSLWTKGRRYADLWGDRVSIAMGVREVFNWDAIKEELEKGSSWDEIKGEVETGELCSFMELYFNGAVEVLVNDWCAK